MVWIRGRWRWCMSVLYQRASPCVLAPITTQHNTSDAGRYTAAQRAVTWTSRRVAKCSIWTIVDVAWRTGEDEQRDDGGLQRR